MLNEIGRYQLAKLLQIPVVIFLEKLIFNRRVSFRRILAISVVIDGVAVATLRKFSTYPMGSAVAFAATITTGTQQILIADYQTRYEISSTEFLAEVSLLMGGVLFAIWPALDFYITGTNLINLAWSMPTIALLLTSCLLAVWVNISAYICIGALSALTFQVNGHIKTATIVFAGWLLFGDMVYMQQVIGMDQR